MSDFISKISAPYNFVPLSEKIVFPDWGERISQDIPFSDGADGELKITVEAMSDIFIRNGNVSRRDKQDEQDSSFFHCNEGEYYIPGSSLKGMIRNVVEIATLSRMQHISDKRYAMRDLQLKAYRDHFTNNDLSPKTLAGFLDISSEDWKIIPCDWAQWERNKFYPGFGNRRLSAAEKYLQFPGNLEQFADVSWIDKRVCPNFTGCPHNKAVLKADGEHFGWLVFTGQPQEYRPDAHKKNDSAKKHEFFFYNLREQEAFYVDDPASLEEDEFGNLIRTNQKDFRFIHCEQTASNDFREWESGNLKDVRNKYFKGRIPIFYLRSGNRLRFGLARMFRFAGMVSTAEALRNTSEEHYRYPAELKQEFKPDMADAIFGYTTPLKSLRGRVQFSACKAEDGVRAYAPRTLILGSPKPSFYPAYIKQPTNLENKEQYKTFLNEDAELRGWKRYPALGNQKFKWPDGVSEDTKMQTQIEPLPIGTTFTGVVRYHNLRPVELGALIWALQMRSPNYYCHTIGMAKPYGYGRIKIRIENLPEDELKRYMDCFEEYMLQNVKDDLQIDKFQKIPQIEHLLRMAQWDHVRSDWNFSYMELNQHSKAKSAALTLEDFPIPQSIPTQRQATASAPPKEISLAEKFVQDLPAKLKDCNKMLKSDLYAETKFSAEQIGQIRNKYKNDLKNKYNPDSKVFEEEIKKHQA